MANTSRYVQFLAGCVTAGMAAILLSGESRAAAGDIDTTFGVGGMYVPPSEISGITGYGVATRQILPLSGGGTLALGTEFRLTSNTIPDEIAKLDAGTEIKGWTRTGYTVKAYLTPRSNTATVCRFYIPPALGDSHFFGRDGAECDATARQYPALILEDREFMHLVPAVDGVCPANTSPIYRVFNNRAGANHRYTTDSAIRDQMLATGWLIEGDGPDHVATCGPR